MHFRTKIPLYQRQEQIRPNDSIYCIGSCFADNLYLFFDRLKFRCQQIPNGILYNPVSISRSIERICSERPYVEEDLVFSEEIWYSWEHHGSISSQSKQELLDTCNNLKTEAREFLRSVQWCILTLGTSFVFSHNTLKRIVANCHKIPAKFFERYRLSTKTIIEELGNTIKTLQDLNPEINIILTVSPIRHIRDGLVENQRSKSSLLLAADTLVHNFEKVTYFPSYEILMDDLRDYRFYKDDLIHPTHFAVQYILEQFQQVYFTSESKKKVSDISPLIKAREHRPMQKHTDQILIFSEKHLELIRKLKAIYPEADFSSEIKHFESMAADFPSFE
jgi:hypothetical protein